MTANMNTASGREPSDIELLLPWYAAGTLDHRESQQVETALANDPELARRYEWVRAEFAQETVINEAAGEPSDQDVKSLFARIDALPVRRPRVSARSSVNLGDRIAAFFAALSPRTLAWSAMAAALAIVLQAGVLAGIALKERSPGGYETASAPTTAAADGAQILIRFQPQASAADIATFLDANKLSIVGGPSGGQLFRVRVASTKLAQADLMRIVKTLQDDKVVGFIAMTD
jgi:anti-sigma factor RsiW